MAAPRLLARVLVLATGVITIAACGSDDGAPKDRLSNEEKIPKIGNRWVQPYGAPRLSDEEKIAKVGNKWAPLFAAANDRAACMYQTQPLCDRTTCEHIGGPDARPEPIQNCTPPSSGFRKSFEDAAVQDIAIKGDQAGAKFSNGELVEFIPVAAYVRCIGSACPERPRAAHWLISNLGGSAKKYFE